MLWNLEKACLERTSRNIFYFTFPRIVNRPLSPLVKRYRFEITGYERWETNSIEQTREISKMVLSTMHAGSIYFFPVTAQQNGFWDLDHVALKSAFQTRINPMKCGSGNGKDRDGGKREEKCFNRFLFWAEKGEISICNVGAEKVAALSMRMENQFHSDYHVCMYRVSRRNRSTY